MGKDTAADEQTRGRRDPAQEGNPVSRFSDQQKWGIQKTPQRTNRETIMKRTIRKPGYSIEHDSWFIPLTQGVIALVDGKDIPTIAQKNWCADNMGRRWYAKRRLPSQDGKQRKAYMHRQIMSPPDGMEVDHINHRPMSEKVVDNRRENLRICTRAQNNMNLRPRKNSTSRYKGVGRHKHKEKWRAYIGIDKVFKHLGWFDCEIQAAKAYDAEAKKIFGEFANLNFGQERAA